MDSEKDKTGLHGNDAKVVKEGLLALYTFKEGEGSTVHDVSGTGEAMDLTITDAGSEISWIPGGGIKTDPADFQYKMSKMNGQIASVQPVKEIIDPIKSSNALTVDVWVRIPPEAQTGPVRIVSISESTSSRNFTIGQSDTALDVRLRNSNTNSHGLPSCRTVDAFTLQKDHLTHIVYTYSSREGRLYVDNQVVDTFFYEGETVCEDNYIHGTLEDWDNSFNLILGNEFGGQRAWKGEIYRLAFYDHSLSRNEVAHHFAAGHQPD